MRRYEPRPWRTTLVALLAIPLVGVLDGVTGQDVFFATVYLVPVMLAGWFDGRTAALLVSVAAATSSFLANFVLIDVAYAGRGVPYWNTASRFAVYVVVGLVVTALRSTMEEQARLAAIVEASSDAIVGLDLAGRVRSWNTGAERLFGIPAASAVGRSAVDLLPPDQVRGWERVQRRLLAGLSVGPLPTVRLDTDDHTAHASLLASPIRGPGGALVGLSIIARDVSPLVETQQALRDAKDELERSNRDLASFAYVVSHDLREPLRGVSTYIDLLVRRYGDRLDDGLDFAQRAGDGCRRMNRMLDDLLAYSRVGSGGGTFAPVHVGEVVDDAVANLDVPLRERDGEVVRGPLPTVVADRGQLLQLFQNLVGNGLKFQREGVPPRVEITAEAAGDDVAFRVRDNGVGIAVEDRERVFRLFQRLGGTERVEGSGIGLPIVKRIVERHGGRIWIEASPEHGTTFAFTLPRDGPRAAHERR